MKSTGAVAGLGLAAAHNPVGANTAASFQPTRHSRAKAQDQIELTIWTAFPELDAFLSEVGPKYTELNPNVTIVNTLFPQRALDESIAAALPAGQGPDILQVDDYGVYPYYANGEIAPITGETADYIHQNWPEFAVTHVTSPEGEIYGLPWIALPKMMFYNTEMFEAAGISATPETVDEMMEMAEQLTVRDDGGQITTQGLDLRLSGGGSGVMQKFWGQAMIPYGADVLVESDGRYRAGYGNERGAAAVGLYLDALHLRNVSTFDIRHDAEGFGLGEAAMFQRESWVVDYLDANAPEISYDVFPMPAGPGGWGTIASTLVLSLPSSNTQQEESLEFIRWLTNEENSAAVYDLSGWQPWRTDEVDFGDLFERKPVLEDFMNVLSLEGHTLYSYENIPPILEIHGRMADRLVSAFPESSLAGDQDALVSMVEEMADQTNRILEDWDLLAEE
jgi:multiple sugar transport system substrate-binding protein